MSDDQLSSINPAGLLYTLGFSAGSRVIHFKLENWLYKKLKHWSHLYCTLMPPQLQKYYTIYTA